MRKRHYTNCGLAFPAFVFLLGGLIQTGHSQSLESHEQNQTQGLGIPGTTKTISGYDTELGTDAICWSSVASPTPEEGIPFPNGVLVEDFSVAGQVTLLRACPSGNWLNVDSPPQFQLEDFRPRTLEWYNFTVTGQLNLESLDGEFVASDEGSQVAIGIVACDAIVGGFCSPFIHEQANIREARMKAELISAQVGDMKPAKEPLIGDRHGGSHVHAPAVMLTVPSNTSTFQFSVEVPMIVNHPGSFFVIGTLQFFTGESELTPTYRYDVANTLPSADKFVSYQEAPVVLTITDPVKYVTYGVIAIAALVLSILTALTLWYRNHQVLKIAQGDFLILHLFAGLTATISCVLLDPRNDRWCQLSYPMILISLQLFYAISLGRLWRIHSVVSPLLRNRLQHVATQRNKDSWSNPIKEKMKHFLCFAFRTSEHQQKSIRKTVPYTYVVGIVIASTFPQVALQVMSIIFQPRYKSIDLNNDRSIGRCLCEDGYDTLHSISSYAMFSLMLLVLVLLIMARIASQLPSLLNESAVIYDCTLLSVVLLILGQGLIAVTKSPTTSPDVPYLINVFLVLSVTLNSSLRIMIPKLLMVRNGQKVLVSQLVEDHNQALFKSQMSRTNDRCHVSGLIDPSSVQKITNGEEDLFDSGVAMKFSSSSIATASHRADPNNNHLRSLSSGEHEENNEGQTLSLSMNSNAADSCKTNTNQERTSPKVLPESATADVSIRNGFIAKSMGADPQSTKRRISFSGEISALQQPQFQKKKSFHQKQSVKKGVPDKIIRENAIPAQDILLRMIDLQGELDLINSRIMTGMSVHRESWESIRKLTNKLDQTLGNTKFEWEVGNDDLV